MVSSFPIYENEGLELCIQLCLEEASQGVCVF